MLAPGEYLLMPVSAEAVSPKPADRPPQPAPTAPATVAPVEAPEPEPRSFLLTLLRALGAIHS